MLDPRIEITLVRTLEYGIERNVQKPDNIFYQTRHIYCNIIFSHDLRYVDVFDGYNIFVRNYVKLSRNAGAEQTVDFSTFQHSDEVGGHKLKEKKILQFYLCTIVF
jgi:hypothetical protein